MFTPVTGRERLFFLAECSRGFCFSNVGLFGQCQGYRARPLTVTDLIFFFQAADSCTYFISRSIFPDCVGFSLCKQLNPKERLDKCNNSKTISWFANDRWDLIHARSVEEDSHLPNKKEKMFFCFLLLFEFFCMSNTWSGAGPRTRGRWLERGLEYNTKK